MAKITFVVKELNKPSSLALANLSRVVYQQITTMDTNSAYNDTDNASTITKLSSAKKMEKKQHKESTIHKKAIVKCGSLFILFF